KSAQGAINALDGEWGYTMCLYDVERITEADGVLSYKGEKLKRIIVHWAETPLFTEEQEFTSFYDFNTVIQAIACYRKVKYKEEGRYLAYTKVKVTIELDEGGWSG
ncbi:LPD25 domain-containing protein, partial [Arthrospira platensis SPKY1]|nr:LPD25 domain-containing protein [Arthrospira platensis SPKY1]